MTTTTAVFCNFRELPDAFRASVLLVDELLGHIKILVIVNTTGIGRRGSEYVSEHGGIVRGSVLAAHEGQRDAFEGTESLEGRITYRLDVVVDDHGRDQGHSLEGMASDALAGFRDDELRRLVGIELPDQRASGERIVAYSEHGAAERDLRRRGAGVEGTVADAADRIRDVEDAVAVAVEPLQGRAVLEGRLAYLRGPGRDRDLLEHGAAVEGSRRDRRVGCDRHFLQRGGDVVVVALVIMTTTTAVFCNFRELPDAFRASVLLVDELLGHIKILVIVNTTGIGRRGSEYVSEHGGIVRGSVLAAHEGQRDAFKGI